MDSIGNDCGRSARFALTMDMIRGPVYGRHTRK